MLKCQADSRQVERNEKCFKPKLNTQADWQISNYETLCLHDVGE